MYARLGQERREAEQHERGERRGKQLPRRDPGQHDESGDRRQCERREQPVGGAPAGSARDDGQPVPRTAPAASSRAHGPIIVASPRVECGGRATDASS